MMVSVCVNIQQNKIRVCRGGMTLGGIVTTIGSLTLIYNKICRVWYQIQDNLIEIQLKET